MSTKFCHERLERSPFAIDGGKLIGRDPREIPAEDWAGYPLLIGLKAIRAKCCDCAHTATEVRKCVQTDCPLWPLRMGSVPKGVQLARQVQVLPENRSEGHHQPSEEPEAISAAPRTENDGWNAK